MNTTQRADHQSGVTGVNWNAVSQRWRVLVKCARGGYESLGSFPEDELDRAIAMKQEADQLHSSEYQALKAKYGVGKRGRRKAHPWGFPAAAPALPQGNKEIVIASVAAAAPILGNDPAALLAAAERADADAVIAQEAAERANQTALEAMQRATTLWARLAAALRVRHQGSQAFRESPLAAPNGHAEPEE